MDPRVDHPVSRSEPRSRIVHAVPVVAWVVGVAGLLVIAGLVAWLPAVAASGADLDALMRELLRPEAALRAAALGEIVRRGERAAIPGLIDVLYLDVFLDSSVADALGRLSAQTFGHDWRRWVEWLAEREDVRPHADYAAWKGELFSHIDPAFTEFLYRGVKHRARLEEIQWGGVRKDGIPALTDPRHLAAGAARYLTGKELVLGLVVGGEARAYPLRIMDWHEMANDVGAGVPITIAY
jgi:hypothetical protein